MTRFPVDIETPWHIISGHIISCILRLICKNLSILRKKKRQVMMNFSLGRRTALMDSCSEHHCFSSAELGFAPVAASSCQRVTTHSVKDVHGVSVLHGFKYISLVKQAGWWGICSPSTPPREENRPDTSCQGAPALYFLIWLEYPHEDLQ